MFKRFFLEEKNILWAIAINAVIIFLLYFPQIKAGAPALFHWLEYIDLFFVVLFTIEAVVKLRELGVKQYFSSGWNIFDFLIVLVSLPSLLAFFVPVPPHTSFLKILRLGRMVRLMRFMSFIPRMNVIMEGLARALKASVFVMIALIFLCFIISLFTCHFYGKLVPDYFGDPMISMFYIFQMFTVEGWNEIPEVVSAAYQEAAGADAMLPATAMGGLARFYFIIVVMIGGIFGMSLANAVFVDEMMSDNNSELEEKLDVVQKQLEELKAIIQERK